MKRSLLVVFILFMALVVYAHEFWLQPRKFFYNIRETAQIRFLFGENFTGENWSGNHNRVKQLLHITPSGKEVDISSSLSASQGDSLQLPLREEGTHMVLFNSNNTFIDLEPAKFKAYLAEDGLEQALQYRRTQKEEGRNGREYYQRSVKTVLQVGYRLTNACTEPTSLPLDIIPAENPYNVPTLTGRSTVPDVRFRVLFKGHPLPGALVKTWYRGMGNTVKVELFKTNNRGWVTAKRHSGPFLVSCVHMERNTADTTADWQSYWASLSFEYSQFFPKSK